MYRFLLTPRWLALALVMAMAAATMVGLGLWQLSRHQLRSEINARIDAAAEAPPLPLAEVLAAPGDSSVGPPPSADATWSMVSVTGRYDADHEIIVRARSLDGANGFEVITPLVLADGTAVLVDRGFLPAPSGSAIELPSVPAPPSGEVEVVGRVRAPESRSTTPELLGDRLVVRRIDPAKISEVVPYPLYGGYLALTSQTPPAPDELTPLPPERQNSVLNAGYTVQWWAFAALTLFGYGYLAYRHAHPVRSEGPGSEGLGNEGQGDDGQGDDGQGDDGQGDDGQGDGREGMGDEAQPRVTQPSHVQRGDVQRGDVQRSDVVSPEP